MTLPAQLRDIADRIEAIDAARTLVLAELDALAARPDGPRIVRMEDLTEPQQEVVKALLAAKASADSASVQVADEDQPGEATVGLGATPAPIHAGGGAGNEDPAPSSAIEQATSGERARGRMNVTDVLPARIPATPGNESPGQVPSEQPPAAAGGKPVPAFDPLGASSEVICPDCGHPAKNVAGLAIHRGRAHPKKPPIVAGDPTGPNGHAFKAEPVLRHGVEWFPCPQCSVKHTSKAHLDQHIARAHRESAGEAKRPTIAERVAARDASRAADQAKRARRYGRV